MPILQSDLSEVQVGIEASAAQGTAVAATRKIPFNGGGYTPRETRKTLEEHGDVLADTTDVVTSRGSELELSEEMNTETVIGALLCSLASVTPTDVNGAYQWLFTPSVTSVTGLDTATWEIAETDGVAAHYRSQFAFARCTALGIEIGSDTSQLSTTWMGRARKTLAAPTDVSIPARFIIPAMNWEAYLDDTWAGLGTTKVDTLRSASVSIDPGVVPAEAVTGRSDLDVSYYTRGRIRGSMGLTVDHDGPMSSELDHWEAGDLRYVRLSASNGEAGAALRSITIDAAMRYIDSPDVLSIDGNIHTLDLVGQLRADDANNILRVTVVNGLAAF